MTAEQAINQLDVTPTQRHLLHGFAAINGQTTPAQAVTPISCAGLPLGL